MAETSGSLPNWIVQLNNLGLSWYAVTQQNQPVASVLPGQPGASVAVTSQGVTARADTTLLIVVGVVAVVLVWSLTKR